MPGPQLVRSAANSEAMTKCNVIATSACLQSQRQWLSAMPLQPLLFFKQSQLQRPSAMSLQPAIIQKPRGIDLVLCQCNLCLFINLEAMTQCNVIVTSTVTETVGLQTPDRSGRDENVAPPFCQCDPLRP